MSQRGKATERSDAYAVSQTLTRVPALTGTKDPALPGGHMSGFVLESSTGPSGEDRAIVVQTQRVRWPGQSCSVPSVSGRTPAGGTKCTRKPLRTVRDTPAFGHRVQ